MKGPLVGLRVLDISNVIAGPFAAALLRRHLEKPQSCKIQE